MKAKNLILTLILLIGTLALSFNLALIICTNSERENEFKEMSETRRDNDDLSQQVEVQALDGLSEYEVESFKNKGLVNPIEDLRNSLVAQDNLIPTEGVMGGTMHIIKDRIYILSSKWAYAYFEDGHIAGQMIVEYKVNAHGKISWKLLNYDAY